MAGRRWHALRSALAKGMAVLGRAAGRETCRCPITHTRWPTHCSEENVPFYDKCGLTKKEVQMVRYFT